MDAKLFGVPLVIWGALCLVLTAIWIDRYFQGPTDSPFADDIAGTIGLVAYTYAGCGVLSLLFCCLAALRQIRQIRRRPNVPQA